MVCGQVGGEVRLRWYTGSYADAVDVPGTLRSCDCRLASVMGSCGLASSSLSVSEGGEEGLGMGSGV